MEKQPIFERFEEKLQSMPFEDIESIAFDPVWAKVLNDLRIHPGTTLWESCDRLSTKADDGLSFDKTRIWEAFAVIAYIGWYRCKHLTCDKCEDRIALYFKNGGYDVTITPVYNIPDAHPNDNTDSQPTQGGVR